MHGDRSPFRGLEQQIERLQRQFEEALGAWDSEMFEESHLGAATMGIDLADRGDEFVLTADVPGFDPDDIDIRLSADRIYIKAEREHEEIEEDEDELYLRSERARQALSRSCRLPDRVDEEAATATYKNGVLTIHLPKQEPSGPNGTKIDIE